MFDWKTNFETLLADQDDRLRRQIERFSQERKAANDLLDFVNRYLPEATQGTMTGIGHASLGVSLDIRWHELHFTIATDPGDDQGDICARAIGYAFDDVEQHFVVLSGSDAPDRLLDDYIDANALRFAEMVWCDRERDQRPEEQRAQAPMERWFDESLLPQSVRQALLDESRPYAQFHKWVQRGPRVTR